MDQQELHALEDHCIEECDPWCMAQCPVHVDVRAMKAAMRGGDFDLAARIFRKRVPFPGIISHICDRPCEAACRRAAVDESIAVRGLERAAMTYAKPSEKRLTPLPGKGTRVAVVGAGLTGITAAVE